MYISCISRLGGTQSSLLTALIEYLTVLLEYLDLYNKAFWEGLAMPLKVSEAHAPLGPTVITPLTLYTILTTLNIA